MAYIGPNKGSESYIGPSTLFGFGAKQDIQIHSLIDPNIKILKMEINFKKIKNRNNDN